MTALYLSLAVGFFAPVSSIVHSMWRDEMDAATARDIARITAPLPEARESLLPEDFFESWPQRQTPSDLPPRVGFVVAPDRPGRHRAGETTLEFWAITAATWSDEERDTLSREWWCESCLGDHRDCTGLCACPCTLVAVPCSLVEMEAARG